VSSFVRPVVGGAERFVEFLRDELPGAHAEACVVSVAFPGSSVDVVVPYRTTPLTTIPLVIPTRAVMSTLLREARRVGLVLLQSADHPLALLAPIGARRTGTRALTVMHGAQTCGHRRSAIGLAARVFDATFPRLVFRLAPPVALSPSSARFVREEYGLEPALSLPFPLTKLPPVSVGRVRRDGALRVVCASRLSPEKGVDVAIAACSLVDDVELHVYGDGPERPRLERIAADRPWLTLHGPASWDEVIAAQSHAHACISGSQWRVSASLCWKPSRSEFRSSRRTWATRPSICRRGFGGSHARRAGPIFSPRLLSASDTHSTRSASKLGRTPGPPRTPRAAAQDRYVGRGDVALIATTCCASRTARARHQPGPTAQVTSMRQARLDAVVRGRCSRATPTSRLS
jgi:glycosyltransferase involved in cell wall biosynthesis